MKRNNFIKVRVTDSELAQIKEKASEVKLTVSDLLRKSTLDFTLRKTAVNREKIRHLARIGSNINQIARWVNKYKLRAQAIEVILWLNRLQNEVHHFAEGTNSNPEERETNDN